MTGETALPQAVQELIERLRARLDRNRHSHGFACADCAKCADEDAHTDCDALLSAALEALEGRAQAPAPDWQDIETAPKGRERILGGWTHRTYGWLWDRCYWDTDRWYARQGGEPTHWLPFPAPPSTGAATPQEK